MNTRPATCRLCLKSLDPGMGFDWRERALVDPGYLCERCWNFARAYVRKSHQVKPELAALRRWIGEHVPGAPVAVAVGGQVQFLDQAVLCQMYLNSVLELHGIAGLFFVKPLLGFLEKKEVVDYNRFRYYVDQVAEIVLQRAGDKFPTIPSKKLHQEEPQ